MPGDRGDEADRRAGRRLVLLEHPVDEVAVADEVDLHQVGVRRPRRRREKRAWMGPSTCSRAASMTAGSRRSTLIAWATVVVHRRVVHDDDFGAEFGRGLGRRCAHAGRAADDESPLAVVAQPIDNRHGNPLLIHRQPGSNRPTVWVPVIWFNTGYLYAAYLLRTAAPRKTVSRTCTSAARLPTARKDVLRYPLQADDAACQHRGGGRVDSESRPTGCLRREAISSAAACCIRPARVGVSAVIAASRRAES